MMRAPSLEDTLMYINKAIESKDDSLFFVTITKIYDLAIKVKLPKDKEDVTIDVTLFKDSEFCFGREYINASSIHAMNANVFEAFINSLLDFFKGKVKDVESTFLYYRDYVGIEHCQFR